jgi:hypothetical protein
MKRLLFVVVLTLCLSFPAFAGHTIPGDWCDCGSPGCLCDPGETPLGSRASVPNESIQGKSADLGSETLLVFAVLLLMLRYKP